MVLYPFSAFYGKVSEYSDSNHGPLYIINEDPNAFKADIIIDFMMGWPPMLSFLLSIIFALYTMVFRNVKRGLLYLIPAFISIFLIALQLGTVFWLVD